MTNLHRSKPSPMPGSHVLVQTLYGINPTHLPVLLVHVVRATPAVIPDPDTEVLDLLWMLLMNLFKILQLALHIFSGSF